MESYICICCKRRMRPDTKHLTAGRLGICKRCYGRLKKIPAEDAFDGPEPVRMLVTPFYYCGAFRSAVLRYKFMNQYAYSRVFAALLWEHIRHIPGLDEYDAMVSVPLSRKRFLERGYNQADLICAPLAKKLGILHISNGVFRKRHTKPQSSLRAIDRFKNVQDAFIANKEQIAGKRIILFDDVVTMGATMESCAVELLEKGAKEVLGMSLAIVRKGV